MRLPFLQIESDLVAHGGAEVAQLAGCSPAQIIGHVILLRAWAVSRASDDSAPSGLVTGESSGRRIEAAAQWAGEKGALLRALIDSGHVRQEEDGHRVMGLDPYQKAWERNAKAKERMANAREHRSIQRERSSNTLVSGANMPVNQPQSTALSGLNPVCKTQTQMEDVEVETTLAPAPADAVSEAVSAFQSDAFALEAQDAGPKPKKPSVAEALYARLESSREARCSEAGVPFVPQRWDVPRINKTLGPVAKTPKGASTNPDGLTEEQERFVGAWDAYLADPEGASREPAWSLGWFMAGGVRSRYEARALRGAS